MVPGPLAAVTYASIKVVGYAGFAYALNRVLDRNIGVWKFGFAKTGIGLVGGLIYFFAMMAMADEKSFSEAQVYAGALPVRLLAWSVALALFYGFRDRKQLVILALVAGVLWSYLLDGVMALVYRVPGMAMPFC
jgi:dipeptide/tripeptide permease